MSTDKKRRKFVPTIGNVELDEHGKCSHIKDPDQLDKIYALCPDIVPNYFKDIKDLEKLTRNESVDKANSNEAIVSRYKVLKGKTISWYGQMTYLAAGSEVTLASYGAEGIERIRNSGVLLEPIKE